jgi:hypothetical protein
MRNHRGLVASAPAQSKSSSTEYRADAVEPALRRDDAFRQALPISGRRLEKAVSNAWRCAGIGRPARKQKRTKEWIVYA